MIQRERDNGPVYRCRFGGWEAGDKVTSLFANRHLFHPPQCCTVFSFAHKFSFLSLLFKTYRLKVTRNHTGRAGTENCLCIAVNQRRHGTDAKGHLVNIVWDTSCGVWCPGNENGLIKSLTMCWERKSIAVTYHIIVFVACEILYNYQQMFLFCTHIFAFAVVQKLNFWDTRKPRTESVTCLFYCIDLQECTYCIHLKRSVPFAHRKHTMNASLQLLPFLRQLKSLRTYSRWISTSAHR